MAANEVHKGDIGTVFVGTVKDDDGVVVNISAASTRQLLFGKPSGAVLTKTGALTTNGTDGKMQYTVVAGDLDEAGVWKLQGKVVLASGTWYSDVHEFEVYSNVGD